MHPFLKHLNTLGINYEYLTLSFKPLPALKPGTFDAAICIEAPVCGFLPSLAALCLTEKVPKPTSETVSPFPNASPIESNTASTALPAEALVTSADEATASTKSDLFIDFSSG